MVSVGIKELKTHLSRYLGRVKNGEDVLITERGKTIARIVREEKRRTSLIEALMPLVDEGLVSLPNRKLAKEIREPVELPGKPLSEMIVEDRR